MTEVMNQQGGGLDSTLSQPHFSPPTSPPSQAQADAAAGAKSASPPPEATQREGTIVQPLTQRMKTKQSTLGHMEGLTDTDAPKGKSDKAKKKSREREATIVQPLTSKDRTSSVAAHKLGTTLSLVSTKSSRSSKSRRASNKGDKVAKPPVTQRRKPKAKRISMVGGMPHYRAIESTHRGADEAMARRVQLYPGLEASKDRKLALAQAKEERKLPKHRMLPVSRFVPKKDFDTLPANLDVLSPALPKMPYQPAPKNPELILDREYRHKMPMKKGKRSRLAKGKVAHVTNWNEETIKPKGWKQLEETPMYNNGHMHEYRQLDTFISPKAWQLMHPEEAYPTNKKKDMVLRCLEDLRKSPKSGVQAITNGETGAAGFARGGTSKSKSGSASSKGKGKGKGKAEKAATSPDLKQTTDMSEVTRKLDAEASKRPGADGAGPAVASGAGASLTATDPSAAGAASPQGGDPDNVFHMTQVEGETPMPPGGLQGGSASPAPPGDGAVVSLGRAQSTFTEVETQPFEHGTYGKWDKFKSNTGGRARKPVTKPDVLIRKPKFNPSRYVQKHKERVTENALKRREMLATGTLEPQLELEERVLELEERQQIKLNKKKISWDTAVVTDMLKRIVRTENMKLNALEDALHAAIKVGTPPAQLEAVRGSIQTIRRRIADVREALAFVSKTGWQNDLARLLVSSWTPLETFLLEAQLLHKDDSYLQDDTPW